MRERPRRSARPRKTYYIVVALIPALIVVLSITGFVWARSTVTLVVDGQSTSVTTQASRVSDLLAREGVAASTYDIVTPGIDARVESGMSVVVRHAIPVQLDLGTERIAVSVVGRTVADALVAAGIGLAPVPAVSPALETPLRPGMVIEAPRSFVRVEQRQSVLPAPTELRDDSGLPVGKQKVVSEGAPGTVLLVYRVIVTDGVEGSPVLSAQRVLKPAKPRVVRVGKARTTATKVAALRTAVDRATATAVWRTPKRSGSALRRQAPGWSAVPPTGGRRFRAVTTAYSPQQPGLSTRTATGALARYGVCAVDPRVIPLGTRLYVPGYGYAIAADTGGGVRGNHIDLCFDTLAEARAWGRRSVTAIICK